MNIASMEGFCGQSSIKNSAVHSVFSEAVVPTKETPADLASRGLLPKEFIVSELWWSRPHWLSLSPDHWLYRAEFVRQVDLPDTRAGILLVSQMEYFHLWSKYSTFDCLLRVVAWCKMFAANARGHE